MKLFLKNQHKKTTAKITDFLNAIEVPKLSEDQAKFCDKYLIGKYTFHKSMQNGKSLGNDGLTKDFYETFWDGLKEIFEDSVRESKEIGHLSASQRQAIIRLI